jgi:hypothetical protein
VNAANTAAPALPGGAFIVGGLSLLTGLMPKRPGEDRRVFAEKKDSYSAGIEEGKRIVLSAVDLGKQAELGMISTETIDRAVIIHSSSAEVQRTGSARGGYRVALSAPIGCLRVWLAP